MDISVHKYLYFIDICIYILSGMYEWYALIMCTYYYPYFKNVLWQQGL